MTTETVDELAEYKQLIDLLTEQRTGYVDFFITPNNKLGCLAPFIFTWAILENIDDFGYENRWCYHSLVEALGAKKDWLETKNKEPTGFTRALYYNTLG